MQTENGYPQWHMSFLSPKISVRDKWSVMSLTLLLTSNPLVHHTTLEILVFVTDIYEFCFIQLNLYTGIIHFYKKIPYVLKKEIGN